MKALMVLAVALGLLAGWTGAWGKEATALDTSQRMQVQAALAGEGFDPGPVDGKTGPRTRRAIKAWQEANDYVPTGELTGNQVETLLAKIQPVALEPKCSDLPGKYLKGNHTQCWEEVDNQPGCHVWRTHYHSDQIVKWTGQCHEGIAMGHGVYSVSAGSGHPAYRGIGTMVRGKANGTWGITLADGDRYEGELQRGELSGYGTYTWADGDRYAGEWQRGKRSGYGTFTWADGHRYKGEWQRGKPNGQGTLTFNPPSRGVHSGNWVDGCFGTRGGQWATVFTDAIECGFEDDRRILEAVEARNVQLVRQYLKEGVDLKQRDVLGRTALHLAAKLDFVNPSELILRDKSRIIALLLDTNIEIDAKDRSGNTALHLAKHVSHVRALLKGGANVNARNDSGETPLYKRVRVGEIAAARELVKHGADLRAVTKYGSSVVNGLLRRMTEEAEEPDESDFPADFDRLLEALQQLGSLYEDRGLNMADYQDVKSDYRTMHYLVMALLGIDDDSTLNTLKTLGALGLSLDEPRHKNKGHTPLGRLVSCGLNKDGFASDIVVWRRMVRRLADAGANVDLGWLSENGADSPLHLAATGEGGGVCWSNRFEGGSTPLSVTDIMETLVRAGADVNARGRNDQTPLHRAETETAFEFLVRAGADPFAKDAEGFDAWEGYAGSGDRRDWALVKTFERMDRERKSAEITRSLDRILEIVEEYEAATNRVRKSGTDTGVSDCSHRPNFNKMDAKTRSLCFCKPAYSDACGILDLMWCEKGDVNCEWANWQIGSHCIRTSDPVKCASRHIRAYQGR